MEAQAPGHRGPLRTLLWLCLGILSLTAVALGVYAFGFGGLQGSADASADASAAGLSDDVFDTPSAPPVSAAAPSVEILPNVQPQFDPAVDLLAAGFAEIAAATPSLAGFGVPRYSQCLNQALTNGGLGLAFAETWVQEGGETAALHCLAYAHRTRGDFDLAAQQFEVVGARLRAYSPEFAATVFATAGGAHGSQATVLAQEAQGSGGGAATRAITERAIAALEQAFALYDTSLSLDASDPGVSTDYALLLADFGYTTEALDLLEEALASTPSFAPALFAKGLALTQAGDVTAAKQTYQTLIDQNPGNAYAREARDELDWLLINQP